ncbi:hypothetical protein [Aquiflexum sp.]
MTNNNGRKIHQGRNIKRFPRIVWLQIGGLSIPTWRGLVTEENLPS